jgi:Bacterial protein of unknown function (DUF839)
LPRKLAGLLIGAGLAGAAFANAVASPGSGGLTAVPSAQDKAPGQVRANLLSRELTEAPVAVGAMKLDGGTADVPFYGYDGGTAPMVPAFGSAVEAQKTEPDKNTYLRLWGLHGADAAYDYGHHFLYQGHEAGAPGYITRINLDADGAHRVTLLATKDTDGNPLPDFDGSTWDPWAHRLLFTEENGANGGVWQGTPDYPSTVDNLSSVLGKAGYEGIQNDNRGNIYLAEDAGGKNGSTAAGIPHARQPNSFIFRFKPKDIVHLKRGGRLQALQVLDASGNPIVFGGTSQDAIDADIQSPQNRALRTYGTTFRTRWVDVTLDPTTHDANAAAKAASATPFKRPENFQFRPGSDFKEIFFDETGDTTLLAADEAAKDPGGYGSIFKLQQDPRSDRGSISLFFAGDASHASFDNVAFLSAHKVSFVEDRGDGFHTAFNALDSGWVFDAREDYGASGATPPVRWLAEGRDPSATIDSGLAGQPGFTNEGDNEITGIHVSNGDPGPNGILGAQVPRLFRHGWRWFWTQQHGDNTTWEVTPQR